MFVTVFGGEMSHAYINELPAAALARYIGKLHCWFRSAPINNQQILGTFARSPRGWISRLKQIPRPCNLNMTYLSQNSRRWYSKKKYFPEVFFFDLQTCKYSFFEKKYKGIKMPRGWISRLRKITRP